MGLVPSSLGLYLTIINQAFTIYETTKKEDLTNTPTEPPKSDSSETKE